MKFANVCAVGFALAVAYVVSEPIAFTATCHQLDRTQRYLCHAMVSSSRLVNNFPFDRKSEAEFYVVQEEYLVGLFKDMTAKGLLPDMQLSEPELKMIVREIMRERVGQW